MGVTGLWRLIEPAGKPVPIETLENKVLAVDISIWLHQVVKGYQDAKGAPLPNAHLMGLFQRLCKLLYFKIKPVFVFDGGFPELKRETIAKRQDNKTKYNSESERLKREIALILGKKTALGSLLGTQISPKKNKNTQAHTDREDLFKLPALPQKEEESESDSEDEQDSSASTVDLHSVDIESEDFKNMPVKEKYDLLVELKDTRKMNSWGKLHTLPKKSDNFSDFQMQRLLKRRKVQECLQETEKEMGDVGMSLNELESFLNEEGIDTKIDNLPTRRIASNNTTRYLLINNVQQAIANAKKREEPGSSKAKEETIIDTQEDSDEIKEDDDLQRAIKMSLQCGGESNNLTDDDDDDEIIPELNKNNELDEDLEKAIKMSLECVEDPNISASKTDDSWTTYKSDNDCPDACSDSEEEDGCAEPDFSTAKAYIMQYSDFTYNAIDNIVVSTTKGDSKNKKKCPDVNEIIEELNQEKSVIVDNVQLSSGEDEEIEDIDRNETLNTKLIVKTESPLQENRHESNEVVYTTSLLGVEKCIDTVDEMNVTQTSVVCIEKPDDVIALDTSSDDVLGTQLTSDESVTTPHVESENRSDTSDDDFEEVSESGKPAVQVILDMPDTIEDDIFADVFQSKVPHSNISSETLNDKKPLIEMPSKNAPKLVNPDSKNSEDKIENSQNAKPDENSEKVRIKDIEPDPLKNSSKNIQVLQDPTQFVVTNEQPKQTISKEKLTSMVAELETEEQNLLQEKGRMDRIGRNITEQMTKEALELLQIFGIPYIVAPMEAEAQCAFLESVNLTDGTITDDSDIWLFGGRTVYKNFFNQKKHVLQFLNERIEKSFNLSREQLILLALLVGSDYTTGVQGVGPVTALEILASFPYNKRQLLKENAKHDQYKLIVTGLQEFKTWVRAGRRTDNITLKKKLRNVVVGDDFPSVRVVQAYLDPNVEKSKEKFTWGELDITILRDYAKAKFGWSQNKLDVILQPVLKRMSERKTQKSVQDYFKRKIEFQSLEDQMSKRVKAAVQKMDTENENKEATATTSEGEPGVKAGKKRKGTAKKLDSTPSTSATQAKSKKKMIVEPAKVSTTEGGIEINIVKTDRYQEIIPQREKDMQNILQNKLKAIEIFRKTKIDRKRKPVKKRVNLPKDKADLSESSDSN